MSQPSIYSPGDNKALALVQTIASMAAPIMNHSLRDDNKMVTIVQTEAKPNSLDSKPSDKKVSVSVNSIILGLFLGYLSNLSTVIMLSVILIVVTNQPLPDPVAETIGYKYPYRALQALMAWGWDKVHSKFRIPAGTDAKQNTDAEKKNK